MYVQRSGEIFDDARLQLVSEVANETIKTEVKGNLPTTVEPPRISSLFNFNKFNFLSKRPLQSDEDDLNNEIENSDVIEIEVPVIGSEYARLQRVQDDENEYSVETSRDYYDDDSKDYSEVDIFSTQSTSDISLEASSSREDDDLLTFSTDFQTDVNEEVTSQPTIEGDFETTTTPHELGEETSSEASAQTENYAEVIQSMESKLMEQWKATDDMIDESVKREISTAKPQNNPIFPFLVKIFVDTEDQNKGCKKTSCSQVSFSRPNRDIDPESSYADYSDEDFKSKPERIFEMPNEFGARNARRAADDMPTPAPRIPPIKGLPPIKKTRFIEQLENESSLERHHRVNKNLDNLARFVQVWAQVDRFVSERARSTVRKIVSLSGDDYGDNILGSRILNDKSKRMIDEPFTWLRKTLKKHKRRKFYTKLSKLNTQERISGAKFLEKVFIHILNDS